MKYEVSKSCIIDLPWHRFIIATVTERILDTFYPREEVTRVSDFFAHWWHWATYPELKIADEKAIRDEKFEL